MNNATKGVLASMFAVVLGCGLVFGEKGAGWAMIVLGGLMVLAYPLLDDM